MAFDFNAVQSPFRMQPGLRRLAPQAGQLTPLRPGDRTLREKLAVLSKHAATALLSAPGFDAAPAQAALFAQAGREHPHAWIVHGTDRVEAPLLGWAVHQGEPCPTALHAVEEIGACLIALPADWRAVALFCLAFAEDLAVIDGDTARIPWLAVCLPSHWAPETKIGRHFAEVHAPVADNQLLITASEHLARLVTGSERWERHVWTITRHPELAAHPSHLTSHDWPGEADVDGDGLAAMASFRTERQTFIPLDSQRQALFTILVESRPLTEAINTAEQAARVRAALASMSPAVLAYRGLVTARERLLNWLQRRFDLPPLNG